MQACADICQAVWQVLARLADIRQAVLQGLSRLADICKKDIFEKNVTHASLNSCE